MLVCATSGRHPQPNFNYVGLHGNLEVFVLYFKC